jgi:hypothetical protein
MAKAPFDAVAKGLPEVSAILEAMSPDENPAWVKSALFGGAKILQKEIIGNLHGPRPAKLGKDSGDLIRSIGIVSLRLPDWIRVGTRLRWAGMYEFGPMSLRKPFIVPAVKTGTEKVAEEFHRVLDRTMISA